MNYDLIFYENDRGLSPIEDFLDDLQIQAESDKSAKQLLEKIYFYFEILSNSGTRAGMPYTRFIGNGLWELRPKDHRIFFFGWEGNKIVLLHSFRKETKKTPAAEIKKAEKELSDWIANGEKRLNRKRKD